MSINDWRSNARPPQFETLEQRIEREAREERRRAFAANVPGPRHATTVDPQADTTPPTSAPTLAELDALAEALYAAIEDHNDAAEEAADWAHAKACSRAGVNDLKHYADWCENRRKPAQKPPEIDAATEHSRRVVLEILRADVERFRAVAAAREEDDIVAARKATTRADAVESVMATLTAESERDRRVGAAVMAWECHACGNTFAPRQFPNSCGYCMGSLRDAVAAALREEASDA